MAITHEPAKSPQKKRGQIKKKIMSKIFKAAVKVACNAGRALARKEENGAQSKQKMT